MGAFSLSDPSAESDTRSGDIDKTKGGPRSVSSAPSFVGSEPGTPFSTSDDPKDAWEQQYEVKARVWIYCHGSHWKRGRVVTKVGGCVSVLPQCRRHEDVFKIYDPTWIEPHVHGKKKPDAPPSTTAAVGITTSPTATSTSTTTTSKTTSTTRRLLEKRRVI